MTRASACTVIRRLEARAYLDTLQNRLRALPGVDSVSLAQSPPLGRRSEIAGIDLDGRHMRVQINRVDPQFFQTMKIPLLRGRNLVRGEAHAIVVGESLARAAWPGQDPLGNKFTMDEPYTVVGIAGTARVVKLEDSDSVEIYFPIAPADLPGRPSWCGPRPRPRASCGWSHPPPKPWTPTLFRKCS